MRRHVLMLALIALGWAARAECAETSVAVLGLESIGVPETQTQKLTEALRQSTAAISGVRVLPAKDLIEMKMIFGCDSESPTCLAQAGRSLGADKVLYGGVRRSKTGETSIALKLLDVAKATVDKSIEETVAKRDLAAANLNPLAARWIAALVQIQARATLTISSVPSGALVAVDGQLVGRTPVVLHDLVAGSHSVGLLLTGHLPVKSTVELRPGATETLALKLEEETPAVAARPAAPEPAVMAKPAAPAPVRPRRAPGRTAKIVALAALAGAVVLSSVAVYTWRAYSDMEGTAHADLVKISPSAPTAQEAAFFSAPTCTPPASLGASVQPFRNDCQKGQSFATATTALWATAGGAALSSVAAFIIGERQAARGRERAAPKSSLHQVGRTLRVAPVVSLSGGALTAAFEF